MTKKEIKEFNQKEKEGFRKMGFPENKPGLSTQDYIDLYGKKNTPAEYSEGHLKIMLEILERQTIILENIINATKTSRFIIPNTKKE